jgi:plastocyanin
MCCRSSRGGERSASTCWIAEDRHIRRVELLRSLQGGGLRSCRAARHPRPATGQTRIGRRPPAPARWGAAVVALAAVLELGMSRDKPVYPIPPAPSGAGTTPSARVEMTNWLQFQPAEITVVAGGEVLWTNRSRASHTVSDDPSASTEARLPSGADVFDSGDVAPGEVYAHTFTVPGRYVYVCRYYASAGMTGVVNVVGPNESR